MGAETVIDWNSIILALITAVVTISTGWMVYQGKRLEAGQRKAAEAAAAIKQDVRDLHVIVNSRLTELLAARGGEQKEIGRQEGSADERARAEAAAKDLLKSPPPKSTH